MIFEVRYGLRFCARCTMRQSYLHSDIWLKKIQVVHNMKVYNMVKVLRRDLEGSQSYHGYQNQQLHLDLAHCMKISKNISSEFSCRNYYFYLCTWYNETFWGKIVKSWKYYLDFHAKNGKITFPYFNFWLIAQKITGKTYATLMKVSTLVSLITVII